MGSIADLIIPEGLHDDNDDDNDIDNDETCASPTRADYESIMLRFPQDQADIGTPITSVTTPSWKGSPKHSSSGSFSSISLSLADLIIPEEFHEDEDACASPTGEDFESVYMPVRREEKPVGVLANSTATPSSRSLTNPSTGFFQLNLRAHRELYYLA